MKNIIVLFSICVLLTLTLKAQENQEPEKEAIKKVIVDAYVDGLFNEGNVEKIQKGWHKDCDIVVFKNNDLQIVEAAMWVERFKKNPTPLFPGTKYDFTYIHVTGYAAIAIVEIYQNGKHIYTDFMNLYKFDDGWKIVTKTYYGYPKD